MSKLENKYNNPIDQLLEKLYAPMMPGLHRYGVTPNMLTTASAMCGGYAVKLIWDGRPKEAAAFFAANYFFDCMDGHMARTYKMESRVGDWYDHITDALTWILAIYALSKNNDYSKEVAIPLAIAFGCILCCTAKWFGCQETLFDDSVGASLSPTRKFCKNPDADLMSTRLFGAGTMNAFAVAVIYFSRK